MLPAPAETGSGQANEPAGFGGQSAAGVSARDKKKTLELFRLRNLNVTWEFW